MFTLKDWVLAQALSGGDSGGSGGGGGTGGGDNFPIGDGNTHIWISLPEGRTSPMLGVCPKGTVTVDWGDGTEPDVLTGTSVSAVQWTPTHNYAKAGDYIITLMVDGVMTLAGGGASNELSCILRHSSSKDVRNRTYHSSVRKIEIGQGVLVIRENAFNGCGALTNVVISGSVTTISATAFYGCYSLGGIKIPDSVTSIGNNAFYDCGCVRFYDFTRHTSVPALLSTSAFTGISDDCEIRVPAALYDEWITATNWSSLASKIVAV